MTAGTEVIQVNWNLGAITAWATGTIAVQRGFVIQAPNWNFTGASTITKGATFAITNAPQNGGNTTYGISYALWVQAGLTQLDGGLTVTGGAITPTTTTFTAGTTGNQTANTQTGNIRIAAAGTTVTVTNSLVTATSKVICTLATNDTTALIKNCVPGAGSFVITLNAAATAEVSIAWAVFN
jgi:hypothetical protein